MIEIYVQNLADIWFAVALNQQQIVATTFRGTQKEALNSILHCLPFNFPFQVFHEPTSSAKTFLNTLHDLYLGKDAANHYTLATDMLPPYSQKILQATATIPVGYVTSYGALAKAVGGGPRAVGNVMASNPFMPLVPCHRVVKSDYTLGGYGGGLKVKVDLLSRERRGFVEAKQLRVNGGCLDVFPVEYVLNKLGSWAVA
jgi:O-6-methylguanine DNA methyltransferase